MAGRDVAEKLLHSLIDTMEAFVVDGPSAFIGMGVFKQGTDLGEVLSQVDAALIGAEADGVNAIREAAIEAGDDLPKCAGQWSVLIRQALERKWVRLRWYGAREPDRAG